MNLFLNEPDVLLNENFILPKSMHLCMIKFIDNTSIAQGGVGELQQEGQALISNINKCAWEEREACALGGNEEITYEQEREMAHQELHVSGVPRHLDCVPIRPNPYMVGMYQFESNRVSLGQVMAVFRPV